MNTTASIQHTLKPGDRVAYYINRAVSAGHRRDDVSFEQAIKQLRIAMHGDRRAQMILDEIGAEHHH
jgi:hypothetical protein